MDTTIVYGCPGAWDRGFHIPVESGSAMYTSVTGPLVCTLTDEDKALLRSVEEKLSELLKRTAPEAEAVKEIKRRVSEALEGK